MSFKYNIKNDKNIATSIYFNPNNNNLDDIKILIEDEINVNPNSEIVQNSYKHIKEYIYSIITKSEFLCKGLSPKYIRNSFNNADGVIIIGSSNVLPNGNVYGFALLKFDEKKNAICIDVICSHKGIKGAGHYLLKQIEAIAKKLSMTQIYLTSVDTAISFYEKYNFKKKDMLCADMCLMIKSIKSKSIKSNESKSNSNSSRTKKNVPRTQTNKTKRSYSKS